MNEHSRQAEWGLTVLRIMVGIVFAAHGAQKLFIMGLPNVAGFFGRLGLPAPMATAVFISAIELCGGVALILGWPARIAAALLAVDMLGAIATVHLPNGFFLPNGMEFALTLLGANAALTIGGPGMATIADVWSRRADPACARHEPLTAAAGHR